MNFLRRVVSFLNEERKVEEEEEVAEQEPNCEAMQLGTVIT